MGAKVIILANPYTYMFLKGLTHSAMWQDEFSNTEGIIFYILLNQQEYQRLIENIKSYNFLSSADV